MSTKEFGAVQSYCIVFDDETIKFIASKMFDDFDASDCEDIIELASVLCDNLMGLQCFEQFVGKAAEVDENGECFGMETRWYNCEPIVYMPNNFGPSLFYRDYEDMDEIVDEFKENLDGYLPEDFDYRSRIRHICGIYYE